MGSQKLLEMGAHEGFDTLGVLFQACLTATVGQKSRASTYTIAGSSGASGGSPRAPPRRWSARAAPCAALRTSAPHWAGARAATPRWLPARATGASTRPPSNGSRPGRRSSRAPSRRSAPFPDDLRRRARGRPRSHRAGRLRLRPVPRAGQDNLLRPPSGVDQPGLGHASPLRDRERLPEPPVLDGGVQEARAQKPAHRRQTPRVRVGEATPTRPTKPSPAECTRRCATPR